MSNFRTESKVAILTLVGLIVSLITYNLVEVGFVRFVVYVFAFAFAATLTACVSGFVSRNVSGSKNVNATVSLLFATIISFAMNGLLDGAELFRYIGIICAVILLINIFVSVAGKLFK